MKVFLCISFCVAVFIELCFGVPICWASFWAILICLGLYMIFFSSPKAEKVEKEEENSQNLIEEEEKTSGENMKIFLYILFIVGLIIEVCFGVPVYWAFFAFLYVGREQVIKKKPMPVKELVFLILLMLTILFFMYICPDIFSWMRRKRYY